MLKLGLYKLSALLAGDLLGSASRDLWKETGMLAGEERPCSSLFQHSFPFVVTSADVLHLQVASSTCFSLYFHIPRRSLIMTPHRNQHWANTLSEMEGPSTSEPPPVFQVQTIPNFWGEWRVLPDIQELAVSCSYHFWDTSVLPSFSAQWANPVKRTNVIFWLVPQYGK